MEDITPEFPGQLELKDGSSVQYYREHINHYFDVEVHQRVLNLSPEDKNKYFQMVNDYGDLLGKILDDVNHPIFNHLLANPWSRAEEAAAKSNVVIDYEAPRQLLQEFIQWKEQNGN